jgi:thymidylate synthase (FAD)
MSITIVTEPKVYLVGLQRVDLAELSLFLHDEGFEGWHTDAPSAGETLIEIAGRNCYQSFQNPRPGGNEAYIRHLLEVGHGSVLEHCVFSFILTGVSRSFSHELVRHRVGFSYSQLSQRYVDESDVAFVVPPLYRGLPESHSILCGWRHSCSKALETYRFLVDMADVMAECQSIAARQATRRKVIREAARSVLPECTETKIFVTANVRALRHFLELRGDPGADAEIRSVAVELARVLKAAAPHCFADAAIAGDPPRVTVEHHKV